MQELGLHAGHVHACGALALAAFALYAQVHGLFHLRACEPLRAELTRQRQTQGIGASAGQVLLVAGHPVRRAHRAGIKLAAVPVVVAHLDRLAQALCRIFAGTARRDGHPIAFAHEPWASSTLR